MQHSEHTAELKRVRRIEGQIRGIGRLIEEKKYCVDILIQIKAARSALKSLELSILEEHMRHCVVGSGGKSDKIEEIMELLRSSARS